MDLVAHLEKREHRRLERQNRESIRQSRSVFYHEVHIPLWKRPFIRKHFTDWQRGGSPDAIDQRFWGEGMYFTFGGYRFFVRAATSALYTLMFVEIDGKWRIYYSAENFLNLVKEGTADAAAA